MSSGAGCIDFFGWPASNMDACFTAFDKDCDGNLNFEEFRTLCRALFRNADGETYDLAEEMLQDVFGIFDEDGDGNISRTEFVNCWNHWIKTIVRPVSAILIVDVQNDFISGSLDISNCPAKQNGEDVIEPINRLLDSVAFDSVYYSYDWHPSDHVSFIENVGIRKLHSSSPVAADKAKVYDTVIFDRENPMTQKLWPRHCVQNSWGSELHKNLKIVDNATKIYKGTNPEVDSYSLFWDNQKLADTILDSLLKQRNVTDLYVCGLAYDVCVAFTAKDALTAGYRTILLDDCCRGVDLLDIEKIKGFVKENHGVVVDSHQVKAMVEGNDRRPELAYKLAVEYRSGRKL